jgi:hypothetical protein
MNQLSSGVVEALLSAGATKEMIESAEAKAREEHQARVVKDRPKQTERKRRQRAAQRAAKRPAVTEAPPTVVAPKVSLGARLSVTAEGNVDPLADPGPIADLLEQGCDLHLDILPTVARMRRRAGRRASVV